MHLPNLLLLLSILAQAPATPTAPDQARSTAPANTATVPPTVPAKAPATPVGAGSVTAAQRADNGFLTGEELFRRCTDSSPSAGLFCFGYIAAINDSVKAYEHWLNIKEYCAPQTVSLSQLRDTFVDEGRHRPAALRGQAASFVVNAFKRRYPC